MQGLSSTGAPVIDEHPDREISKTDRKLVVHDRVPWCRLDKNIVFLKFNSISAQRITRLSQKRKAPKHLRDIQSPMDREVSNPDQLIAHADAGPLTRAPRGYVYRYYLGPACRKLPINPGNSIIVKRIGTQMLEAQHGSDHSCNRTEQQECTSKLISRLAHKQTLSRRVLTGSTLVQRRLHVVGQS